MDAKLKAAIELLSLSAQLVGALSGVELHLEDAVLLARAVEGEGAALFSNRNEVGQWIAHTAMNRTQRKWWPHDLVTVVTRDFHGYANCQVPQVWALQIAVQAMLRTEDMTGGAVFVLNRADLQKLGYDKAGYAIKTFAEGEHELYFFKVWPW